MPRTIHLLALALLLMAPAPAAAATPVPQAAMDIAGTWQATVMGQPVTVRFTQNGNLISGLLVLVDATGKNDTYHLSGTISGGFFAAVHGGGHMLRGWLRGPDEADGELTLKDAPPIAFPMRRTR